MPNGSPSLTMPRDSQGNMPKWVLIGGGIVGVFALYTLMKNKQSGVGGGTVAAGTSINAALGSLQEEMLNTQGAIGSASARSTAMSQAADAAAQDRATSNYDTLMGIASHSSAQLAEATGGDPATIAALESQGQLYGQAGQSILSQAPAHIASAATGTY